MIKTIDRLSQIRDSTAFCRKQLDKHPLYLDITTVQDVCIFMQSHVFAVWDFMSLLKALQAYLTTVSLPWVPTSDADSRRLINDIVLGEESDSFGETYVSHFELYLDAMRQAGADIAPATRLIEEIKRGESVKDALVFADAPEEACDFVQQTFAIIETGKPHSIAAAFTFGRESLIPDMFRLLVRDLRRNFEGLGVFEYYLERHIEVDGDSHGPMSLRMLENLCGDDDDLWNEAGEAAMAAIDSRIALWDGIRDRILSSTGIWAT